MNPDREFHKRGFVEKSEIIQSIIRNPIIVKILEILQGVEVCALMSQVLFKRVGTERSAQAWNPHQDNSYPRAKDGTYITINIFLSDADRENGCLYLYPGSHKEGLFPFEPVLSYHEKPGMNPGNNIKHIPDRYVKMDLLLKKGDVLIMNGNLVHGSYPNASSCRSRPLFSVSYINFGVPFWPGDPARSDKRVMRLR
jgi:ectoine hydroxylase-related dioxygenase (phytanoyl-CoA dioxygenase family)